MVDGTPGCRGWRLPSLGTIITKPPFHEGGFVFIDFEQYYTSEFFFTKSMTSSTLQNASAVTVSAPP